MTYSAVAIKKVNLSAVLKNITLDNVECANVDAPTLEEVKAKLEKSNPNVKWDQVDVTTDQTDDTSKKTKVVVKVKSTSTHYNYADNAETNKVTVSYTPVKTVELSTVLKKLDLDVQTEQLTKDNVLAKVKVLNAKLERVGDK
ncbi:MAG: hypothetical protein U9532_01305 ['Conium maculatum' witches'-broom phytoplasma]|nr:hypothetical protein ['Conium maculatum' witches'-broom phytoplasma]